MSCSSLLLQDKSQEECVEEGGNEKTGVGSPIEKQYLNTAENDKINTEDQRRKGRTLGWFKRRRRSSVAPISGSGKCFE